MSIRNRSLTEAINVAGAEFIGNGKNYDVFDIRTWAAADRFKVENTQDSAGQAYVHDQRTFEQNINDAQHLYYFAQADTNKVFGAVVKSDSTRSTIAIANADDTRTVNINCNFLFENARLNSSKCLTSNILPLYLIPDAIFEGVTTTNGVFVVDRDLVAVIGALTPATEINLDNLPELYPNVWTIAPSAFTFGVTVSSITLSNNFRNINAASLTGVQVVNVPMLDETDVPESWNSNWKDGKSVIYAYGMSEEDIARLSQEKAEEIRRQREIRDREEAARREAERKLQQRIRYKVEGNEISVIGGRPTGDFVKALEIPAEIDGKPVTKIKAHAFAYSDIEALKLPRTLKLIEREAFYGSNLNGRVSVPSNCIIGKDAFTNTGARVSRSSSINLT